MDIFHLLLVYLKFDASLVIYNKYDFLIYNYCYFQEKLLNILITIYT